jgi:adenylate kinase family enzyme
VTAMPRFIKDNPEELAAYIVGIGRGLIAFDGRPTAGKTPLARDMAKRVGCAAVDADKFLPVVTDDDFEQRRKGSFVDKLRIDDMRRAIEAGGPLVLLSGVCARQVVERLQASAAAVVWVQKASLSRLDQMCRDFFEYDEDTGVPWSKHSIHKEVQAYIDTYDARRRPDVIYMNAHGDRVLGRAYPSSGIAG